MLAHWRNLLTDTGRIARVASLIADSLRLPGPPEEHSFLTKRLIRFVQVHGLTALDELIDANHTDRLRSIVGVQNSWFWREPEQFVFLLGHLENRLRSQQPLRIWSAAASAGQEPYSLAMAFLEATQPHVPAVRILATDLDSAALELGRRGVYDASALTALPDAMSPWLMAAPLGSGAPGWQVRPEVSQLVDFKLLDLLSLSWSSEEAPQVLDMGEGLFDAIFCRNVLLYFAAPYRYAILEGLARRLAPGGLLCLGQSETIGIAGHLFEPCGRGMYLRPIRAGRTKKEVHS
jgi:chemotaxis protein methyltransferase CheR